MGKEGLSEPNPFFGSRGKLEGKGADLVKKDAEELKIKLEKEAKELKIRLEKEAEELKIKLEKEAKVLVEKLEQAKTILVDDVRNNVDSIPPRDILSPGKVSFESESFAWFFKEDETLLSPSGSTLASASRDGNIRLWDVNTGDQKSIFWLGLELGAAHQLKRIATNLLDLKGGVSIAFSPSGTKLVSVGYDKTIRIWNSITGGYCRGLPGHTKRVRSAVAFSPVSFTLASASRHGNVSIWDANTGGLLQMLRDYKQVATAVAYSPDGAALAAAGEFAVHIWSTNTGLLLKTLDTNHDSWCTTSVAFSPGGSKLATAGSNGYIHLWNVKTGKFLRQVGRAVSTIMAIAFSPNGSILASASKDGTVKIWNVESGEGRRTLKGHLGRVNSVAFSPDGSTLATASEDKTVRIWDPKTGKLLRTMMGHRKAVTCVAFSPITAFINQQHQEIYETVQSDLSTENFELSTKNGIEFTISW